MRNIPNGLFQNKLQIQSNPLGINQHNLRFQIIPNELRWNILGSGIFRHILRRILQNIPRIRNILTGVIWNILWPLRLEKNILECSQVLDYSTRNILD